MALAGNGSPANVGDAQKMALMNLLGGVSSSIDLGGLDALSVISDYNKFKKESSASLSWSTTRYTDKTWEKTWTDEAEAGAIVVKETAKERAFVLELGKATYSYDSHEGIEHFPLIDRERFEHFYKDYFYNQAHAVVAVNLADASEKRIGPTVVICLEGKHDTDMCKVVVYDKQGATRYVISQEVISKKGYVGAIKDEISHLSAVKMFRIRTEAITDRLLKFETQTISHNYKFGILYQREGQTLEDEFYNNENGSLEFESFLDWLGDRVTLKGWEKYRGGLDVKADMTGTHSIYTEHEGQNIMFHVSTLLVYFPLDPQQVERKRHLGNDVVILLFQDGDCAPFDPSIIRSQFNHVWLVVRPVTVDGEQYYKMNVICKSDVYSFPPAIPAGGLFPKNEHTRTWILSKLLNGERAAYYAGDFVTKFRNTNKIQLEDIIKSHEADVLKESRLKTKRLLSGGSRIAGRLKEAGKEKESKAAALISSRHLASSGRKISEEQPSLSISAPHTQAGPPEKFSIAEIIGTDNLAVNAKDPRKGSGVMAAVAHSAIRAPKTGRRPVRAAPAPPQPQSARLKASGPGSVPLVSVTPDPPRRQRGLSAPDALKGENDIPLRTSLLTSPRHIVGSDRGIRSRGRAGGRGPGRGRGRGGGRGKFNTARRGGPILRKAPPPPSAATSTSPGGAKSPREGARFAAGVTVADAPLPQATSLGLPPPAPDGNFCSNKSAPLPNKDLLGAPPPPPDQEASSTPPVPPKPSVPANPKPTRPSSAYGRAGARVRSRGRGGRGRGRGRGRGHGPVPKRQLPSAPLPAPPT